MKDSELIFGLIAAFGKESYSFADLQHLTAPFDISESSLRTSLSRMTSRGTLEAIRKGRKAYYRLGAKGSRISANVSRGFDASDWHDWDGSFWGVLFSVPDVQGAKRYDIRKKLQKYRFACMYPGFWIRPASSSERIPKMLESMIETGHCSLIKFYHHQKITKEQMSVLWKLDAVNAGFSKGITLLDSHMQTLDALSARQALTEKMTVGNEIVNLLFEDPLLPPQFLPEGWAADMLRERFKEFDAAATLAAKPYWQRIYQDKEE